MSTESFQQHIDALCNHYEQVLARYNEQGEKIEALLVHSGSEAYYYADDRNIPFQAYGHYLHWLPVNRPDQFAYFRPGQQPIYFQVIPDDYWHDQSIENTSWWADSFQIIRLGSVHEIMNHLPETALAYLGPNTECAKELGIGASAINPQSMIHYLDYQRAYKSTYEVAQLKEANRIAVGGHKAAQEKFLAGGNEYEIHMAYLNACSMLEDESPYTNIVALDENSAILHYQYKKRGNADNSQVLLIDAGCRVNGYGSDVTRTSVKKGVHRSFKDLLRGMEEIEQALVAMVKPGIIYTDIHIAALHKIGQLLIDLDICRGTADELMENETSHLFMPHGVGHLLGIQVHDVGGHQQDINGAQESPPQHSPALRNTRELGEGMVFTIEPGCYFIPLLLEAERSSLRGKAINWKLVDELYPCGGIRVEDNVLVTADGAQNLTRPFE
ncbi:MAG: Xaa-Pro dipeptidase [Gammaproteobacteria bacterium]|nr:Xaa-Pro dipeptidase [Gammaproteobacteria bacterium]MDD9897197.1 Xaa-Pro dipeptidase [Gammaproteobacteria bacterium]MDD9958686.1 Xaa-Pro dipeptidase [Gammaproteobacteria bacterium]